ncbi:hypothetical protein [Streptomyces sp. HPF1205]|uniref:hypothetical protein n=1 Tax=Streptomyces sp. HPF1205 TaxID=2873262 RepID=UPI001CECBE06|nr:hypothetical protein [Streptomyces sp. HPF1205]
MSDRSQKQINSDLDSLDTSVRDLNTKLKSVPSTGDLAKTSADVAELQTSVKKLKNPAFYKPNRAATGAITTRTVTAIAASATATLAVSITLFKIDEKGITILGVTREMPWKKAFDKLQKLVDSPGQKEKRRQEAQLKDKVEGLGIKAGKVDGKIRDAKSEVRRQLNQKYGPLIGRVERIETKLREAAAVVDAARKDRTGLTHNHKGARAKEPAISPVAKDVVKLQNAVDKLVESLAGI